MLFGEFVKSCGGIENFYDFLLNFIRINSFERAKSYRNGFKHKQQLKISIDINNRHVIYYGIDEYSHGSLVLLPNTIYPNCNMIRSKLYVIYRVDPTGNIYDISIYVNKYNRYGGEEIFHSIYDTENKENMFVINAYKRSNIDVGCKKERKELVCYKLIRTELKRSDIEYVIEGNNKNYLNQEEVNDRLNVLWNPSDFEHSEFSYTYVLRSRRSGKLKYVLSSIKEHNGYSVESIIRKYERPWELSHNTSRYFNDIRLQLIIYIPYIMIEYYEKYYVNEKIHGNISIENIFINVCNDINSSVAFINRINRNNINDDYIRLGCVLLKLITSILYQPGISKKVYAFVDNLVNETNESSINKETGLIELIIYITNEMILRMFDINVGQNDFIFENECRYITKKYNGLFKQYCISSMKNYCYEVMLKEIQCEILLEYTKKENTYIVSTLKLIKGLLECGINVETGYSYTNCSKTHKYIKTNSRNIDLIYKNYISELDINGIEKQHISRKEYNDIVLGYNMIIGMFIKTYSKMRYCNYDYNSRLKCKLTAIACILKGIPSILETVSIPYRTTLIHILKKLENNIKEADEICKENNSTLIEILGKERHGCISNLIRNIRGKNITRSLDALQKFYYIADSVYHPFLIFSSSELKCDGKKTEKETTTMTVFGNS